MDPTAPRGIRPWSYGAAFAAGAALLLYGGLVHAPTEQTMGDVQRIFYFHVPAATNAALAFLVATIGAVGFLARRGAGWERLSRTAIGTGLLWATLVLVTGPIWARPAWGTWWTWEPRLTTSLIAWLIYIGALLVRRIAHDPEQGARLGSVIAIVGFFDLPIVFFSVRWWRGNHPLLFDQGRAALSPKMWTAFFLGLAGVTLIHLVLFGLSWRATRLAERLAALERRLDSGGRLP